MDIDIKSLISPVFIDDLMLMLDPAHEYTEYVEPGGRASTKSSFLSIAVIILIESNPAFNCLVCRKVADTLNESVYEQIKWAIDKLGLSNNYKCTVSPLRIERKATGQRIVFRGADRPEKIKSIKLKTGYFALAWFEETTEFTPTDIETIKLSVMRGGDIFFIFYSYNPPASARNWCNAEHKINKPGRLVHRTDYRTTPREWLGPAFLAEAEYMRQTNERAYRNIFLGEATGSGRTVFENVRLEPIESEQYEKYYNNDFIECGLDWGYYPDPLAFNVSFYDPSNRTLYIYGELELRKSGNENSYDKIDAYMHELGLSIQRNEIIADSAEPKSIADFKAWGAYIRGANKGRLGHDKNKGKTSREASFKWLQSLAAIIIDPDRCPHTADEFTKYEYDVDKKSGEVLEGYPDGQPDHHIDALRYGNERYWRRSGE